MKNWTLVLALGTAVATTAIALAANPASAATFNISFTIDEGDGVTEDVVGKFITGNTPTIDPRSGFSGFLITSLTGTQDEEAISLLPPFPAFSSFRGNNNLFNPNEPFFDIYGVSYIEESGQPYQLYYDNVDQRYEGCNTDDCNTGNQPFIVRDLKITKVPEPTSTLSLLALGTLGAASTLKRKLKPSKSTEKETTKVS
jgi:hypothetical protein